MLAPPPHNVTVMPAPVPMAMARTDVPDVELVASEVWPMLVGTWRTDAPTKIPPCGKATAIYTYSPLANVQSNFGDGVPRLAAAYPFEGTTTIKFPCCTMEEKTTGLVSGDGTSLSATNASGHQSQGTLSSYDARTKTVTYALTGSTAQGHLTGTSVVEPTKWTDTVTVSGRTMVFVFTKVA